MPFFHELDGASDVPERHRGQSQDENMEKSVRLKPRRVGTMVERLLGLALHERQVSALNGGFIVAFGSHEPLPR